MRRQILRRNVPYRDPVSHPQKTVTAMRLLAAISDHAVRVGVTHSLYKAYWYEQKDVTDLHTLQEAVEPFGLIASDLLNSPETALLRSNTLEATEKGAFGVPRYKLLLFLLVETAFSV